MQSLCEESKMKVTFYKQNKILKEAFTYTNIPESFFASDLQTHNL